MMYEAIKNFPGQFAFDPVVENAGTLKQHSYFIVAGMGGSHLAADLVAGWKPEWQLVVHSDYGLPYIPDAAAKKTLVIASSYSGNTEETLDGFEEAGRRGLARAAVAVGGKLRDLARNAQAPFVQVPDTGIQPRSSIGFGMRAILALMGEAEALAETTTLSHALASRMDECEAAGRELAGRMAGFVPVVYASERNRAVAYNWKIKFNETGKIPAFYNAFPELNHNEMTGFDRIPTTRPLSEKLFFIFLRDGADHPKVQKRMAITEKMYKDRGLECAPVDMRGGGTLEKIFSSALTADFAAYFVSQRYGTKADQVPMVEEFKRMIA